MAMFWHIKSAAETASRKLAMERGEAPDAQSTGMRNCHLLAVAPNASSSIICGNTSPSIEPYRANAYTQKTKSGTSLQKNEFISKIFSEIQAWTLMKFGRASSQMEVLYNILSFLMTGQKMCSRPQ